MNPKELDLLVKHAADAADTVAIGYTGSGANLTRSVLRRGLQCLIDNGLIVVVPTKDWPDYVYPDGRPPWDAIPGKESEGA